MAVHILKSFYHHVSYYTIYVRKVRLVNCLSLVSKKEFSIGTDGPTYYGKSGGLVDNGPIVLSPQQPSTLVYVSPNEVMGPGRVKMMPSSTSSGRSRLYLARRDVEEEPLVISMTNGDNEEAAVKKIVLDPDNGIVVTQDKARKKRSASSTAEDEAALLESSTTTTTTIKDDEEATTETSTATGKKN